MWWSQLSPSHWELAGNADSLAGPSNCPALAPCPPRTRRPLLDICHPHTSLLTMLLPLAHAPAPNRVITSAAPSLMWVSTDPLVLGRSGLLFHGHTLPRCSWGLGVSDPSRTLGNSSPNNLQAATPHPVLATTPPRPHLPRGHSILLCPRLLSVQLTPSHFLTPRDPRFLAPGGLVLPLAEISRFNHALEVTFTSLGLSGFHIVSWPSLQPLTCCIRPAARSLPTAGWLEGLPSSLVSLT